MLKDRRALIEAELKIAKNQAGAMYLDIVTSGGDVHSATYQLLRDRVGNLQFDLDLINHMIDHERD